MEGAARSNRPALQMLDNPGIIITIILIAVVAIIPGWLIRIWIYRIEVRRVMEKMAQAKEQTKED